MFVLVLGAMWFTLGFTAGHALAMCCKLAALEKIKVLVPLHLAYLPVNLHGINPHEGEQQPGIIRNANY
jgi:hypothetical protein